MVMFAAKTRSVIKIKSSKISRNRKEALMKFILLLSDNFREKLGSWLL
jgi:hypothetical protein